MINNKIEVRCETCGKTADALVVADGFDDEPSSFTVKRMCRGNCAPTYAPMAPRDMQYVFKLPLSGWSETRFSS